MLHAFVISNAFFNSASVQLKFFMNELQMLLRYYLIHIAIYILRHIYLKLCPCLGLGLFVLYLCDVPFIFILIFIVISHITSFKQTNLLFCSFFRISPVIFGRQHRWRNRNIFKQQKFSLKVLLSFCLIFSEFQHGVAQKYDFTLDEK